MKTSRFILMIAVAFILSFSTKAYTWDQYTETDYTYADWDASPGGVAGASYIEGAGARADTGVSAYYGRPQGWAFALAMGDMTVYIVDYDPNTDPPLVGEVYGVSRADAAAYGYKEISSYDAWSSSGGYGGGGSCYAYAEISDPEDSDSDYGWFETEVDMSYNGASCSYGDAAFANTDVYSAQYWVECESRALSRTYENIVENWGNVP